LIGILVDQIDQTQAFIRLIFALLMVIIVIFLGGAIHGAVLGLGLSAIDPLAPKGRYIYSAAIAKGITQGILIPLFILVTALIAVYNNAAEGQVDNFLYLFGFYGLVYGLTFGRLLGILDT